MCEYVDAEVHYLLCVHITRATEAGPVRQAWTHFDISGGQVSLGEMVTQPGVCQVCPRPPSSLTC